MALNPPIEALGNQLADRNGHLQRFLTSLPTFESSSWTEQHTGEAKEPNDRSGKGAELRPVSPQDREAEAAERRLQRKLRRREQAAILKPSPPPPSPSHEYEQGQEGLDQEWWDRHRAQKQGVPPITRGPHYNGITRNEANRVTDLDKEVERVDMIIQKKEQRQERRQSRIPRAKGKREARGKVPGLEIIEGYRPMTTALGPRMTMKLETKKGMFANGRSSDPAVISLLEKTKSSNPRVSPSQSTSHRRLTLESSGSKGDWKAQWRRKSSQSHAQSQSAILEIGVNNQLPPPGYTNSTSWPSAVPSSEAASRRGRMNGEGGRTGGLGMTRSNSTRSGGRRTASHANQDVEMSESYQEAHMAMPTHNSRNLRKNVEDDHLGHCRYDDRLRPVEYAHPRDPRLYLEDPAPITATQYRWRDHQDPTHQDLKHDSNIYQDQLNTIARSHEGLEIYQVRDPHVYQQEQERHPQTYSPNPFPLSHVHYPRQHVYESSAQMDTDINTYRNHQEPRSMVDMNVYQDKPGPSRRTFDLEHQHTPDHLGPQVYSQNLHNQLTEQGEIPMYNDQDLTSQDEKELEGFWKSTKPLHSPSASHRVVSHSPRFGFDSMGPDRSHPNHEMDEYGLWTQSPADFDRSRHARIYAQDQRDHQSKGQQSLFPGYDFTNQADPSIHTRDTPFPLHSAFPPHSYVTPQIPPAYISHSPIRSLELQSVIGHQVSSSRQYPQAQEGAAEQCRQLSPDGDEGEVEEYGASREEWKNLWSSRKAPR